MSPSTATNRDLHSEAEAIAKRILSRKVTDHDATLVFELSNRLLRAEGNTQALQATASAARHACKLVEQQYSDALAQRNALVEVAHHVVKWYDQLGPTDIAQLKAAIVKNGGAA